MEAALAKLEASADGNENLLAAAVTAARARATLGEISAAMEKVTFLSLLFIYLCVYI